MYEESKLAEAQYFYSQMVSAMENRETFVFNLSAFLSSARSVLQYALEEAQDKADGQKWYDNQMAKSNVFCFFKDKRDINIHSAPLKPNRHTAIELTSTLHISSSLSIQHFGADGKLISEYHELPKQPIFQNDLPPKISYQFTFPDWSGEEDIVSLCLKYLDEPKRIVHNGYSVGVLSK